MFASLAKQAPRLRHAIQTQQHTQIRSFTERQLKYKKDHPNFPRAKDLINRFKIVRGDMVEVIHGTQKGERGKIKKVIRRRNKVLVEGVNMKEIRTTDENGTVRTINQELNIHYSNVALVDPETDEPTKVNMRYTEDGRKVRIAKKSGVEIPYPVVYTRSAESFSRDTAPELVLEVTYEGR